MPTEIEELMDQKARMKLLLLVIACCALLMCAQIVADMTFTVVIMANMDISGLSDAQVEEMLAEKLAQSGNGIMLLAYALTFVGLLFWAKKAKTPFAVHTGLNLKTTKPIGILAVLAGVVGNIWFGLMVNLISWPESWMEEYDAASSAITSGNIWVEVIAITLMAPIIEEILFRGMVYRYLSMALPAGAALVFQGLLFGGMHGTMIWIVYASVMGCVLGYVRKRTGSLHATILMHIGFNGGSYLFAELLKWWGERSASIVLSLVVSGALFLLLLYGIEYRMESLAEEK